MAKTHKDSVLTTSCIQTPVNPHTRTPLTLYEREEEEERKRTEHRHLDTTESMQETERESCEDDLYLDSNMERDEHYETWKSKEWFLDISKTQNSDKEYYMQLEKLKTAHLENMEQLERMYQQKLHLSGVQSIETDQEAAPKRCRSMWEHGCLQPAVFDSCLFKHNSFCNVSSCLSECSLDELTEVDDCSDSEGSIAARDKIDQMWNGFTVEDYIQNTVYSNNSKSKDQAYMKKSKEWSPSITIPEPFQMTMRESKKKEMNIKSKSEIELENSLLKKRLEEEAECQKKFRAKPIPASVYLPLYHEIVQRNEERRTFVKGKSKEILLASQKPFQFIEREERKKVIQKLQFEELPKPVIKAKHFKAKPVPKSIYGNSAKERLKEEELYRGIKIQMRAQELLCSSSYPTSTLASGVRSGNRKTRCFGPDEELEHKPKISTFIPNFAVLHQKQHNRLSKHKNSKHVTVCEPFQLRTVHRSHQDKILKDIEADEENLKETRWPYKSPRKCTPRKNSWDDCSPRGEAPSITPKSTQSSKRRQQAIRKAIEEKEEMEEAWNKRRARLKHEEKLLKKHISSRARAIDPLENITLLSHNKLKELRKQEKQRTKTYLEELGAMKERVSKKPLLFERASQKNACLSAEKHYSGVLKNLGLCEEFVLQKGQTFNLRDHARVTNEEQHLDDKDSTEGTLELEDLQDDDHSYKKESDDEEQEEYSTDDDHSEADNWTRTDDITRTPIISIDGYIHSGTGFL
ncbi:protein FAM161A [Pelodytes ibericus]